MSFATSASAKALFGDMMTPQQKIAANTPARAITEKFADFLAEKQPANSGAPGIAGFVPSPERLAKDLFGEAYDPANDSVRLDKLAGNVQKHSAEFAEQFRRLLAANGVDPNTSVELSLGADGRIIVDNTHPNAAAITKLFEDNPGLAQAYRNISAQNDHLAILQVGAAYVKEWHSAATDSERLAAWTRYSTLMDRLSGMFSGRMTFGPGTAVAESLQMVRRMGLG